MRRYVSIGGIVVTMLFAGSVTALAQPPAPDPTCAPAVPEPDSPGTREPGSPEPGSPEPGSAEPGSAEPGSADPGSPEPGSPEPGSPEPGSPEPGSPEPGSPEPGSPEPGSAEPGSADPDITARGAEPAGTEPAPSPAPPSDQPPTLVNPVLINPILVNPTVINTEPTPPAAPNAVAPNAVAPNAAAPNAAAPNAAAADVEPAPRSGPDPAVPNRSPAPVPTAPTAVRPATEQEPGQDQPGQDQPGQDQPGQDEPGQDEPGQDQPGTEPIDPNANDPAPANDCPPAAEPGRSAGDATSAARKFNWGEPNRVDEFEGGLGEGWNVYDGPGHAGKGRRTPDAVSVEDGILTITGNPSGATAGMAWNPGQKYGRWEGRVKAPASDESYNALLLMWPDAENFPVGGEIDFMEMMDRTRQTTDLFLHYGASNSQVHGSVKIDATEWHNWALEWTPTHIAAFVDGKEWWRTTDTSILPPGPMHLCIQLDWFPKGGNVQQSYMYVDWVKQYSLDAGDAAEGVVEDLGQVVEGAGAAVEGTTDAATSDLVGGLTAPLTEGRPDAAPARRGLIDTDAAPARRGLVDSAVPTPGR